MATGGGHQPPVLHAPHPPVAHSALAAVAAFAAVHPAAPPRRAPATAAASGALQRRRPPQPPRAGAPGRGGGGAFRPWSGAWCEPQNASGSSGGAELGVQTYAAMDEHVERGVLERAAADGALALFLRMAEGVRRIRGSSGSGVVFELLISMEAAERAAVQDQAVAAWECDIVGAFVRSATHAAATWALAMCVENEVLGRSWLEDAWEARCGALVLLRNHLRDMANVWRAESVEWDLQIAQPLGELRRALRARADADAAARAKLLGVLLTSKREAAARWMEELGGVLLLASKHGIAVGVAVLCCSSGPGGDSPASEDIARIPPLGHGRGAALLQRALIELRESAARAQCEALFEGEHGTWWAAAAACVAEVAEPAARAVVVDGAAVAQRAIAVRETGSRSLTEHTTLSRALLTTHSERVAHFQLEMQQCHVRVALASFAAATRRALLLGGARVAALMLWEDRRREAIGLLHSQCRVALLWLHHHWLRLLQADPRCPGDEGDEDRKRHRPPRTASALVSSAQAALAEDHLRRDLAFVELAEGDCRVGITAAEAAERGARLAPLSRLMNAHAAARTSVSVCEANARAAAQIHEAEAQARIGLIAHWRVGIATLQSCCIDVPALRRAPRAPPPTAFFGAHVELATLLGIDALAILIAVDAPKRSAAALC